MKKIYSGILSLLTILLWTTNVSAQCTTGISYQSATISPTDITQVTFGTCWYAGEYAPLTVNGTGNYDFSSGVATDYLTITDGSGSTVIAHGPSPLSVSSLAGGSYRLYVHADAACTSQSGCRALRGVAIPTCTGPTAVSFSNVGSSTADASWSAPTYGTPVTYEYVFGLDPNTPTSGTTTTATSLSFTGLNPGSTYTLHIRTNCTGNDQSSWDSYSVSTTCPASFSAPYFTSFEASGVGDPCWTQDSNDDFDWSFGGSTPSSSTGPSSAFDGSQFGYTESSGNSGETGIFLSPEIDLSTVTNPTVRFNYHMYGFQMGSMDLEVESPAGSGNWTLVWSEIGDQGNQWREAIVPLTPFAGQTVAFRFFGVPGGTTTSDMAFDNFSVEDEFCVTPFDVIIDAQGLVADVSWTTLNADSVAIAYREAGATTWDTISGLTSSSFTLFGLTELTSYELTITAYCSSTGGTATTQIITFSTPDACVEPTGLATGATTGTSIEVSWTSGGATEFDLQYGPSGFVLGTGTVSSNLTSNTQVVGNLATETSYDFYVRDNCGANGVSDWVGPITGSTDCAPFSNFPWADDFEGASAPSLPDCWSLLNGGTTDAWVTQTSSLYARSGTQSASLYTDFNSGNNDDYLILPAFNLPTSGIKILKYWVRVRSSGEPNDYRIVASTGGKSPTDFNIELQALQSESNTTYEERTLDISSLSGDVYIAMHVPSGGLDGWYLYFDDFSIDVFDCEAPTNVAVSGVTSIGADVTWDANVPGPYELAYGPSGFDPGTGGTVVTGITSNIYSISGLSGLTDYDVYVRAICSTGNPGASSSVTSFTTLDGFTCTAPIVVPATGLMQNFDSESTCGSSATTVCTIGGNWTNIYSDNQDWLVRSISTGSTGTGPSSAFSPSNYIYTEASITSSGYGTYQAMLISDCFDISALSNPYVNFQYHMWSTGQYSPMGTLELQVLTANLADWTTIWSKSGDQGNQWNAANVYVGSLGTNQVRFRFVGTNGGGYQGDIGLDDIEVASGAAPGCLSPGNVVFSGVGQTSANASWIPGGTETAWNVEVTTAGSGPGSGTIYPVSGNPSLMLSNLNPSSTYDVFISSTCSGAPVNGPFSFTTECGPISSFPWSEDFESSSSLPACFQSIDNNSDNDQWAYYSSSSYANSGSGTVRMYTDYNGGNNDDYLILPEFVLTGNEQLRFSARNHSASEPNDFEVYISTTGSSPSDFNTTVLATTALAGTAYQEFIVDLSSYSGNVFLAIHVGEGSLDGWYLYVDDIFVEAVPGCPKPTSFALENVTGTSASFSWVQSSGTATLNYGPVGFDPISSGTSTAGLTSPGSITGLAPQTSYDVYVQRNCGGNGDSDWTGPLTITTSCATVSAPFLENFDGPTWGVLTTFDPCWQVLPDLFDPNWQIEDGPTGSSSTGPNNDVSGTGQYAYVETSGGAAGDETYLVLPVINISALSNPGIEFFYHMFGANTGTLEVQVRNAGSAAWNTVWSLSGQQQSSSADAWAPASASLIGYSGDVEIQFVGIHTVGGCCTGDMAIDEVKVDNVCPAPSNVSVSNVFDTSFDVSWTGSGSNYQVEIVTSGTAPSGSGTAVTGTSYTASGLSPETSYDIYIYQDCGFGISAGASATQITSYCPPPVAIPFSALPYNENFDALGAPRIPCGWLVDDANVDAIVWEGQDRSSLSQSNPNALQIERNSSADMDDWIFSPEFIVPGNTSLDITFSYRVRTNQYVEKLEVFVGNSQDSAGMNLKLFDVPNLQNSFYKTVTVSYTTLAAENIFIGLHGYSDADQFALYIDDFEVKEADCPTPFLLSAVGTGQTTADLSWNGPGDTFIVEYGPAGFAPGTGTTVIAGGSPLSISGLEVGADYEFYVQNDCNGTGDGLSQNAGPAAFSTDCPSITASETMSCPDGSPITLIGSPAGGVFSGPGLTGNVFDPTSVQPGTYTLNYTVTNAFGTSCPGTIDITVNPFPNVVFGDLGSYCDGQNGFTITTASPTGGTFSGPGIVGTDFVPAQIGTPGDYTLYYTYTDPATGCTAMDSAMVTLIPTPNVTLSASQTSFCGVNDSTVTLNASPAGGVFSGPGVVNGVFDPSIAGLGNHTLRYTFTSGSCATFDQLVMTVNEVPTVTASPDVTVVYGTGTQLSAVATGGSGNYTYSWSPADSIIGTGSGNQVTTGPLTVDQQFVVQAVDNVTGCRGYDTVNVTIFGGPIEVLLSVDKDTICVGETVQLSASVTGGSDTTYSFLWTPSSYVTDINTLSTSSSPIVTTTYSFYVDDTFTQKVEYITVYVNDLPNVQFGVVPNQCVDGGAVMLTQGSPAGGTYSGAGVTGAMFDPAAAGVGTHTLTYTFMNANGCEASATTDLIVSDVPTVTMGALADVCAADAPFALTVGAPVGGTYSGNGVSNGIFDPAAAGQGPHNILYTYTDANGCTSSASTLIIVNQAAIGFHLPIPDVCTDAGAVTLTGAIPPGGTYTGPGVNGGVFYPAQVGPGTYTLDYETLSVSGCPLAFQATITVNAVPSVSTPTFANTCSSAASFALSGATPAGGNWSGPGVSGGNFDPAVAGAGTHVLTYTYTSADGCPASSTSTIVVTPAPVVSLAPQANLCANASPVLISGASPGGGVYSGPGVSGNTFDPVAAGSGTHTITYSYTNPEGCIGTATTTITVDARPNVSFNGIGDVCASAAPVAMTGNPAGGTFSGPGIVNGDTFDPTIVAPGTYTITYTYTDPATGCTNSASQQQNVNADPAAPIILQNGCDLIVQSSVTNPVYTWLDDQGNVVGSGSTITTPCVGFNVYFVEVEDPVTGCTSTSTQFVASYVSLEDELTSETIEVYPNPNRGSFELSIAQLSADNVEVAITDARGRLIMEEEVEHTNGASFERNYNLENVENGVYFIRVTAEGHSSVKRIVVEK